MKWGLKPTDRKMASEFSVLYEKRRKSDLIEQIYAEANQNCMVK